jgi:hypothetical protein
MSVSAPVARRDFVLLVTSWTLGLFAPSCVPMTFSREEAIDFNRYRSVRVVVVAFGEARSWGEAEAAHYLADELVEGSGFERVTTDPNQKTDLVLEARLSLRTEVSVDEEGDESVEYHGEASFTAFDEVGARVDAGTVSDSSTTANETLQDTLDEVGLHYLGAYRL